MVTLFLNIQHRTVLNVKWIPTPLLCSDWWPHRAVSVRPNNHPIPPPTSPPPLVRRNGLIPQLEKKQIIRLYHRLDIKWCADSLRTCSELMNSSELGVYKDFLVAESDWISKLAERLFWIFRGRNLVLIAFRIMKIWVFKFCDMS